MPLPQLSRRLAQSLRNQFVDRLSAQASNPPEKILQFGTGRFLRAFLGDYVDRANRQGTFNGRIVAVQSTGDLRADALNRQDGLYALAVRGLSAGREVDEYRLLASTSRALSAAREWPAVLECAASPQLELIVSNTTEVGIRFDPDDSPLLKPPRSFPGKLTAVLHHRFRRFAGARERGLVIVPCELIPDNGPTLRRIVLELSRRWELEPAFLDWVATANRFCSSLVDRIVTGLPEPQERRRIFGRLGFSDELLTVAEPYSLWAVEGDSSLETFLNLAAANPSIIVAPDIAPYRERKLRLLNAVHTICAPASFLMGNDTVLESMRHPLVSRFVEGCMLQEIASAMSPAPESAVPFANQVLERFRNPFLKHSLLEIAWQTTSKLRVRVLPVVQAACEKSGRPPLRLCLGFAFYLLFMRGVEKRDGQIMGRRGKQLYPIRDDEAESFFLRWRGIDPSSDQQRRELVRQVFADASLWGKDLTQLPGFAEAVADSLIDPQLRLRELAQP